MLVSCFGMLVASEPASAATPWWDTDWRGRARLTFDASSSTEDLHGFVVPVVLDRRNFDFAATTPGGEDLRFVDADGLPLAYELEEWDPDRERAVLWVRVTRIAAGSSTDAVWMYYDNPGVDSGSNGEATWGPEAIGVWHLGPSLTNATAIAEPLQDLGPTMDVVGQFGRGRGIDENDSLRGTDSPFDLVGPITVSAWVRIDSWSPGEWDAFVTKGDDTWRLHRCDNVDVAAFSVNSASGPVTLCGVTNLVDSEWHHVVGTYTSGTRVLYVDGAVDGSDTPTGTIARDNHPVWLANNERYPDRAYRGDLDEVRVLNVARSASWIAAETAAGLGTFTTWCSTWAGGDTDLDFNCDDEDLCSGSDDRVDRDADGVPDGCDPCPDLPDERDRDGDGTSECGDCDDRDLDSYPGATDVPGNGVDEDCDGNDALPALPTADTAGSPSASAALDPGCQCASGPLAPTRATWLCLPGLAAAVVTARSYRRRS